MPNLLVQLATHSHSSRQSFNTRGLTPPNAPELEIFGRSGKDQSGKKDSVQAESVLKKKSSINLKNSDKLIEAIAQN